MDVEIATAEEEGQGEQGDEGQTTTQGGSQLAVPMKTVGKGTSVSVKRRAPGGRGTGGAEESAGDDSEDIATIVQRAVNAAMRAAAPEVARKVTAGLESKLGAMSDRVDRIEERVTVAEATQNDLRGHVHNHALSLKEHDAELAMLRASVARLETEAALVRERAPAESAADIASELEFDRVPDPTILRLQTRQAVQYEKVFELVMKLTEEMAIPKESWRLQGRGTVTNKFAVQMVGESRAGARRSAAVLQKVQEKARSGQAPAVAAPNGADVPVYFNADKNGRTLKEEAGARRLLRIFRTAYPERQFFWPRGTAAVSTGWRSLARVVVTGSDTDSELQWHMPAMEAFGLDKALIAAQWREQASAQAEDVHWTS